MVIYANIYFFNDGPASDWRLFKKNIYTIGRGAKDVSRRRRCRLMQTNVENPKENRGEGWVIFKFYSFSIDTFSLIIRSKT